MYTVQKSGTRDSAQFIQEQLAALGPLQVNTLDANNYKIEVDEMDFDIQDSNAVGISDTGYKGNAHECQES